MSQENKLIFYYSEFKLAFLTVVLLFFIIFPFFLPSRITLNQNLFFVVTLLIIWLASAIIYLFSHLLKTNTTFHYLRYATIVTDILFLSAVLFVLNAINSNYFFLFAFIIIGAAFYLDLALVILSGSLSIIIFVVAFFIESSMPISVNDWLLFLLRIAFMAITTYFVYLFVLSYKEILQQKKRIKKISLLNQKMLYHFSNQLRAPLPVIRDFIELLFLERAGPLNQKQKKILNLLHEDTKNLIEESSSLIYYNQLKTGELYLNKQKLNLVELICDVNRRCAEELLNRKIKIKYLPRQKIIEILADKEKLLSAIHSLLRRIIILAQSSSKISVWVRKSKYSAYLQIIFIYQGKVLANPKALSESKLDIYMANKIINLHHGNLSRQTLRDQKQKIIIVLSSQS